MAFSKYSDLKVGMLKSSYRREYLSFQILDSLCGDLTPFFLQDFEGYSLSSLIIDSNSVPGVWMRYDGHYSTIQVIKVCGGGLVTT